MNKAMITGIIAGSMTLAACGDKDAADDASAVDTTMTDAGGDEVQLDAGTDTAANMPAGITAYPGAEVLNSANVNTSESGQTGSMMQMKTSDDKAKVLDFYTKQFTDNGVTITSTTDVNAASVVSGTTSDGTVVAATVQGMGSDGNMIMLTSGKSN